MNRKLEDKDVFKRFERRNEHTEESTSLGINKHTSVLWNDMHPTYTRRRRRRTISVEDSIPLYPLEIDPQSTIVNGSTSFRRVSSSSIGADSQEAENSNNDHRFQFRREETFSTENSQEETATLSRRRRGSEARGNRSAPIVLQRFSNATDNDSDSNSTGLNDEWSRTGE